MQLRNIVGSLAGALGALFLAAAPGAAPALAQTPGAPGASAPYVEASIVYERASIAPGDQFQAALRLDIDPGGWHVYWRNPGDSGLPPEVSWSAPEGATIGDFAWPAPHAVPFAELMNYGYETQLVLPFLVNAPATLKPGDVFEFTGEASWLVCLDICIPEGAPVTFRLPVTAAPQADAAGAELISAALEAVPAALPGAATVERTPDGYRLSIADVDAAAAASGAMEVRFFPDGHEIVHAAPQPARRGPDGLQLEFPASDLAPAGEAPLSGVLVVETAVGTRAAWTVNALPGPAPAGVAEEPFGESAAPASLGLAAIASLIAAAFVGGLVLNLMPCVLPVLSIKAAGLVHTAHDPKEARLHGLAYLGGVLVCFAAIGLILAGLRMAGEQAGLGFQLQYPPVVGLFALLMFAVGLNLLGVFEIGGSLMGVGQGLAQKQGASGAFFTGVLAAFVGAPCVGPFMAPAVGVALSQPAPVVVAVFLVIGAGLAFPFVALSFTPALARLIPRPGKWMTTFKQVLAFPMFLTVLWLLWVLAGQAGANGVLVTLAAAIVLAFGIWLAQTVGSGAIGRIAAALVILAAIAAPVLGMGPAAPAAAVAEASSAAPGARAAAGEVSREPWSVERVAALQAEGRPVFVDFTARWCVTCQLNKRTSINTAAFADALAETGGVLLEADWTNRDEVIAAELARFGRAGVPLYLVYPAGGGEPEILPQMLSSSLVARAMRAAAGRGG